MCPVAMNSGLYTRRLCTAVVKINLNVAQQSNEIWDNKTIEVQDSIDDVLSQIVDEITSQPDSPDAEPMTVDMTNYLDYLIGQLPDTEHSVMCKGPKKIMPFGGTCTAQVVEITKRRIN
jgi:hypothetical protein